MSTILNGAQVAEMNLEPYRYPAAHSADWMSTALLIRIANNPAVFPADILRDIVLDLVGRRRVETAGEDAVPDSTMPCGCHLTRDGDARLCAEHDLAADHEQKRA